jgi:hypothetical protein
LNKLNDQKKKIKKIKKIKKDLKKKKLVFLKLKNKYNIKNTNKK